MGYLDIEDIIDWREKQELTLAVKNDGKECWEDLCVFDTFGGTTLPCNWLEYGEHKEEGKTTFSYVYLKGKPKGKIIRRW